MIQEEIKKQEENTEYSKYNHKSDSSTDLLYNYGQFL